MDVITLSRLQFAITTIYHYLFIPISLGLSILVAILSTIYLKNGNMAYKRLAKLFGKLFIVSFAMGVVTGIVQEFHFGMNWSEYSRFMGDIFGAPLALEALTAFFLESVFLGVWIFGENRLPKKIHCLSIWLVAFGSNLSSYWILVANSFMQHPVGYVINNGRAEMTNFLALLTNPYVYGQFAHVLTSGITTAGILVVSVSAYKLLCGENVEIFKKGIKIGAIYAVIGLFAVMGTGHLHTQYIGHNQPMKLASMEALWNNADPAPFTLYATIDTKKQKNTNVIEVPYALSFMLNNKPSGEVKGIKALQLQDQKKYGYYNYIPNVELLFWSFRIMLGLGMLMLAMMLITLYLVWKKRLSEYNTRWLRLLVWSIVLPFITNTVGWYIAEGGRQPWMVEGLQKVADAVSQNITSTEVWISLIGFTVVYALLAVAAIFVSVRIIKKDVTAEEGGGL
ncbi:cytochrome ubiquinol oxidase subunit I [Pectinatus sottacetonis]|uniref:cytochrome ubiquinol oxidase subunit I n=1 Tax=Pectinatus sottacetonis TaxID=1002795 RepID=UPI0018C616FC|nr:cytochrome ubiquinol oxidase subunit I [Pectinatus sottacetonis]